jgi:hypothetical protein
MTRNSQCNVVAIALIGHKDRVLLLYVLKTLNVSERTVCSQLGLCWIVLYI